MTNFKRAVRLGDVDAKFPMPLDKLRGVKLIRSRPRVRKGFLVYYPKYATWNMDKGPTWEATNWQTGREYKQRGW